MRTHFQRSPAVLFGCLGTIALLASCAGDPPTSAPNGVSADRAGQNGCSYVTNMIVNHGADAGDGIHFRRISDALAAAKAGRKARGELQTAACRITINVAPGTYRASFFGSTNPTIELLPLMVDVPDITLHGAFVMGLDSAGRATGIGAGPNTTILAPLESYDPSALIIANGHPGGSAGNGLTVEGFELLSGAEPGVGSTGFTVFSMRVSGLIIRGNRIGHDFDVPLDLRSSSAVITQNSLAGTILCDMCLAGPGAFTVSGNLLLAGALEGIFPVPVVDLPVPEGVEPFVIPKASSVSADISNNEVHDHNRRPIGAAIRLGAIGLGGPSVISSGHYTVRNNLLVNGQFGMLMDGSFPGPESKGDMDVAMSGNVMRQNCQANLLVAFARHTTALGLKEGYYERRSTYRIALGGDLAWKDVWFDHPAGFGNTLIVDGQTIPNGHRTSYDPDGCPNPLP